MSAAAENPSGAVNVIDFARRATIHHDPFPHLEIENFLPEPLYRELEANLPSIEYITDGEEIVSNRTYLRSSKRSLEDPDLPKLWRDFIETNTSRVVFESALDIWGDAINQYHPRLAENFGKPLDAFTTARRSGKGDSPANRKADLMIDCQFGVNTPVEAMSSPRGPHVDRGAKLFSSLIYFRDEADESTGGEYELFRLRRGPFPRRKMKKIPERYIESVKKIPYRRNSLVMWINTPEAIHAVAQRSVTPYPRRYLAISGECFAGARPSDFFSHFEAWDRPLGRLRAELGI